MTTTSGGARPPFGAIAPDVLRYSGLGPGDYAIAYRPEGGGYLGRVARYDREWDCWYGAEGRLLSQHHRSRLEAVQALLTESRRVGLVAHHERDVAYLGGSNEVDLVLTDALAPVELTSTAFVVPIMEDGSVILALNRARGPEIPGGHIEPGETPIQAAIREAHEEAGVTVTNLTPIGFIRQTKYDPPSANTRYPHPVSYQQFYAAPVDDIAPYVLNDECLPPLLFGDVGTAGLGPRGLLLARRGVAAVQGLAV